MEIEGSEGGKMIVHFKGGADFDLPGLKKAFWVKSHDPDHSPDADSVGSGACRFSKRD